MDNNKSIVLLGANGFIGKNFQEDLSNEYIIKPFTHKTLDVLQLDKLVKIINNEKPTHIVVACGVGGTKKNRDNKNIMLENIIILVNIIHSLPESTKLIYFGSGIDNNSYNNYSWYQTSKYICRQLLPLSNNVYYLRLFNVYGQYEDSQRFIPSIINNIKQNIPITITNTGKIDFVYVKDISRIIKLILNNILPIGIYDIGPQEPYCLKEVIQLISNYLNKSYKINFIENIQSSDYIANSKEWQQLYNFSFTPLIDGIKRIL